MRMAEERTERRLAAIVAADVVGYTRLIETDEAGTLATLKARRKHILEPLVAKHRGRIVKFMGDGALLEFGSAVDAVQCAAALQILMAEANAAAPTEGAIVLRIGVNLGDVVIEDGDIYGDGVNVAARLEAMAEPGGICLSAKVLDEVGGKADAGFEDLGEIALKNKAKPVRVYRLLTGAAAPVTSPSAPAPVKPSIAILPFANMSGDLGQQYFCDGITEDILTELQRFRTLLVIARNSSFHYRDGASDVKAIGRALGARYLVEGSVRRSLDRVRITAQLIDTETAAHLWADRYDRNITDLFAIQDEISRSIATTLWSAIDIAEEQRAKQKNVRQMQAYDYVLKARNVWFKWTQESNVEAGSLITKALELDSQYATAWAWLAWVHIEDWRRFRSSDLERIFALALDAARKAIALDPHDYFSHWPMGYLLVHSRKYDEGIAEYEKALALNSNDSRLLDEMSVALCLVGRPSDAIAQLKLAIQLDPLHPDWFFGTLGLAHYVNRQYDKAIAAMTNVVTATDGIYLDIQAAAYAQLGMQAEARMTLAEHLRLRPDRRARLEASYPFKNPADFEHLLDGLRKAGLPD